MTNTSSRIVLGVGTLVLMTIVMLQLSTAYLRGGHPPASGILNLLLLAAMTPLALLGTFVGLSRRADAAPNQKWFFVMTGACLAFAVFAVTLLVLIFVLDRSI